MLPEHFSASPRKKRRLGADPPSFTALQSVFHSRNTSPATAHVRVCLLWQHHSPSFVCLHLPLPLGGFRHVEMPASLLQRLRDAGILNTMQDCLARSALTVVPSIMHVSPMRKTRNGSGAVMADQPCSLY